jgi:hypothetical protein
MIAGDETVARELLGAARSLMDRASDDTQGLWPRAAVLLARQSLEVALTTYWSAIAPGLEECSTRAQLLCLGTYAGDSALSGRANQVWAALSRAAHFHPYELPPTREELVQWFDTVREVLDGTERAWNR